MTETFPFAFAVLVVLVVVAVLIAADRWQEYQAGADRALTRSCCEEVTGELCPVDWADLAPAVPTLPDWVDDPQEYGPAFWAITDELDDRDPTLMRNLRRIDRARCIVDREESTS